MKNFIKVKKTLSFLITVILISSVFLAQAQTIYGETIVEYNNDDNLQFYIIDLTEKANGKTGKAESVSIDDFADMRSDRGEKVDMIVVEDSQLEEIDKVRVNAFLDNGSILWVKGSEIMPIDIYEILSLEGNPGEFEYSGFEKTGIYIFNMDGNNQYGLTGRTLFVEKGDNKNYDDFIMDKTIDLQQQASSILDSINNIAENYISKAQNELENENFISLAQPTSGGLYNFSFDYVNAAITMKSTNGADMGSVTITQYRYIMYHGTSSAPSCNTYHRYV